MSWRVRDPAVFQHHWPLNNHAKDTIRVAHGTWVGTSFYGPSNRDVYAAGFNQASHIDCGAELIGSGAATVMAYVYLDDFGQNGLGRIVDNGNFDLFVNDTNDTLDFTSDGGGTTLQSANDAIVVRAWLHVAVSRDSDGTARLYVEGKPTSAGASGTPAAGSGNFMIGDDTADANAFDGGMRDVRHYSVGLSRDEINEIIHGPVAV